MGAEFAMRQYKSFAEKERLFSNEYKEWLKKYEASHKARDFTLELIAELDEWQKENNVEIKAIKKDKKYIVNNVSVNATTFKEAIEEYLSITMAGSKIQLPGR